MKSFRTLYGETYDGYELTHDCRLAVPEVLKQLRKHLTKAGVDYGCIVSCVTQYHPDDETLFTTTIVIGA